MYYKQKMITYPVFASEIARINFTFGNLTRLPSDSGGFIDSLKNAVKSCLNSPCNLFSPMSNSVGKLAQGTLYASNGTILPVGNLKDTFATFTGGIDSTIFNKIPEVIQKSITNLKFIGKNAWSESLTMLTKDDLPTLIEKARAGSSLRDNTAGYRYTPDLKSYLDLSEIAPAILGNIASDMGDCFRQYQQAYRYNPYDPQQNKSNVTRIPIADTSNGITPNAGNFQRSLFGQAIPNAGGNNIDNLQAGSSGNKQTLQSTAKTFVSDPTVFSTQGTDKLTIYGGDIANNTFFGDLGANLDTEKGGLASGNFLTGPAAYGPYKDLVNKGYINSLDLLNYEEQKFNLGFAVNLDSLAKYLNKNGRASYTAGVLQKLLTSTGKDDVRIFAEITPAGKAPVIVKCFDKSPSSVIDLTIPTFRKIFGLEPVQIGSAKDPAKYDGYNVYNYVCPDVTCSVKFIIGKSSDITNNSTNVKGLNPKLVQLLNEFKQAYPNIPVTSGYRSPEHNASVGGASGSQHLRGNALDFSVRNIPITETIKILEWWKQRGARGFGYYPNSQSIHIDIREGNTYYAWGTDYTRRSLPQTPIEFQMFVQTLPGF
jgi:hypothetical protein